MRQLGLILLLAGCLGLVAFLSRARGGLGPQPGDTVTARLDGVGVGDTLKWQVGQDVSLAARLLARGTGDANPRVLTFNGIPLTAHPVASVRFFQGDTELAAQEATLNQRC
jgi:hypothetical protein